MSQRISIDTPDGSFAAYLATPDPATARGTAIVVIQEIFGINADMRETCDNFARDGFLAICPDLYWRQEPNVELTDKTKEEWDKAFALLNGFNIDKGVEDIASTIAFVRTLPSVTGGVGAVGYCLGGLLAFLTATRTDADSAVSYYGVNLDKFLGEAAKIQSPLLMHIAEEDEFVPAEARAKIIEALKDNPHVEIHTYPGCQHAFARNNGIHYVDAAAKAANARTLKAFEAMR
ncbi:dienelactone hydrolase family protein [Cupriavidus plantarum]|uniref:dienelactone hydrolase family protein n=1 Tax=Cupriavidus plantarum TaxID=942865 RepID=UPI000E265D5A|nr:dienelactone hydrolase family protein [Cupriavidus plantarum]REE88735.1 carboxymethylenebutenolidase [Cupriavidus plantarum]RLK31039.1 carboxymethylenebutenolidase [Cupriavidus plantarum]